MRYIMKQKLLSLGDDFHIKDANGRDVYFVDGKAFSIGDQLSFQDLERRELAFIKQRVLSWGKTYEIIRDGQVLIDGYEPAVVPGVSLTIRNSATNLTYSTPSNENGS